MLSFLTILQVKTISIVTWPYTGFDLGKKKTYFLKQKLLPVTK